MMELIRKYRQQADEYEQQARDNEAAQKRCAEHRPATYYDIVANARAMHAAGFAAASARIQASLCRAFIRDLESAFTTNA